MRNITDPNAPCEMLASSMNLVNLRGIQNALVSLKSTRVAERKLAAETLMELLTDNEEICRSLDFYSIYKEENSVTWNEIFNHVTAYFEMETAKLTTRNVRDLNKHSFYISVVDRVVQKGTCYRASIGWKKIFHFLMKHLTNDVSATLYGTSLVSILQNFLAIDVYVSFIDGTSWIALIKMLLSIYNKYDIPHFMVLQCLNTAILESSNTPYVIATLRSKVVHFYESVFSYDQTRFNASNLQNNNVILLLKGLTILCHKNAVEFRGILCKLGESIIPVILHRNRYVTEEERALIEFLLVQVQLHSPCDIDMNSPAFYAHDARKWLDIVKAIYARSIDMIDEVATKKMSHYHKDLQVSEGLILLAAKCTKQISEGQVEEQLNSGDEDDPNPSKKPMKYRSFNNIISDVCSRSSTGENQMVWINYLTAVLTEFPNLVGGRINFSSLFNMGLSFLNSTFGTRREVYSLFICLLKTEKHLIQSDVLKCRSTSWENVWDSTLRAMSMNEVKVEGMELLRKLLIEVQPSNLNSLLHLYLNGSLPVSIQSLQLLAELLSRCSLPLYVGSAAENSSTNIVSVGIDVATTSCPRLALIRWVVNCTEELELGHEPLISTILCSLLVKQTHNLINAESSNHYNMAPNFTSELNPFEITYDDFETILLKCCFVRDPKTISSETKESTNQKILQFSTIPTVPNRLVEALVDDFEKQPTMIQDVTPEFMRKLMQLNYRVAVYMNIINVLQKHSIGNDDNVGFRTNLEKLFDKAFSRWMELATAFISKGKDETAYHVQQVIAIMRNILRSEHLCERVKSIIAQKFSQQMQEILKKVYRSSLSKYIIRIANSTTSGIETILFRGQTNKDLLRRIYLSSSSIDAPGISECRHIELAALEALHCLIDYGVMCDHRLALFSEILKDCVSEVYKAALPFNFEFSSEVLRRLIPVVIEGECSDLLSLVLPLLQKMCKGFHMFPQCSKRLWEFFGDLVSGINVNHSHENKKNFMTLIGTLLGFLELADHRSNIFVYQASLKAIGELAKNDTTMSWSTFVQKGHEDSHLSPVWILNEIYKYLNSSSQQIRLATADSVCLVFEHAAIPLQRPNDSIDDLPQYNVENSIEKRLKSYEKVYKCLEEIFHISEGLNQDENSEEAINRTSVALNCLSRLIFAYPFIQKKSVCNFLKLCKLKAIDLTLAERALNFASSAAARTMCYHLPLLLLTWVESKYSIEEFPYNFCGSETIQSFCKKFQRETTMAFFQKNGRETEALSRFADFLGVKTYDLLKESCAMLVARIIPEVTASKHTRQPPKNAVHWSETQRLLNSALGGQHVVEKLTSENILEIILHIVSMLFDPQIPSAWGCPEIQLPEPSSRYYDEGTAEIAIGFLQQTSNRNDVSLTGFLATWHSQQILANLITLIKRVHDAHNVLEKFRGLHHFTYFVELLSNGDPQAFAIIQEFFGQFVVYAYLRLLKCESGTDSFSRQLRCAVVFLMSKLVLFLTMGFKDEMKYYFHPVVNGVVSSVIKYPDLIEPATKLLDILMKTYGDDFSDCIKSLDPFPVHIKEFDVYREIHHQKKYGLRRTEWLLQDELRACLSEIQLSNGSCAKERLEFVRELLINKKRDLEKLVKCLEGKRFSDECTSDTLHCIIHMLVGVIKNGGDEETVLEASRCLGEIGPVDLSVLVLPTCSNEQGINLDHFYSSVVKMLVKYLTEDDLEVVSTCSEVIRLMLQFIKCHAEVTLDFSQIPRIWGMIRPGMPPKAHPSHLEDLGVVLANSLETKLGLNEMDEFVDYPSWITQLTCGLLECFRKEDSFITRCIPMCEIKVEFCEEILPVVIYKMLTSRSTNPLVRKTVSGYFRNFFSKFVFNQTALLESSRSFTPVIGAESEISIYLNKLALRRLIAVVQYLRFLPAPQNVRGSLRSTPWDSNFWLDINYLDLAKAAQYCGAYLTSILFTEIAATDLDLGGTSHIDEMGEDDAMESFYSQGTVLFPRNRAESFERLLLKAYTSIGEPDAVYGCGSARFSDGVMNIQHLQQRMQYGRVLSASDGNALDPDSTSESVVCSSMKEMGLYNTLWTYLQGIETREKVLDQELADIQYECGWRLSKWNLHCDKATYVKDANICESKKTYGHGIFQRFVYESIQSGLENDFVNHVDNIRHGYGSIARNLRHASVESSENLYGFLSRFQMIRVIEDFFQTAKPPPDASSSGGIDLFLKKWKSQDKINSSDFKFQEPILYLRSVLLRSFDKKFPREELEHAYDDCMLELVSKARDSGRLEFAENCASCVSTNSDRTLRKDVEIAKNHWARGDQDIAKHILHRLIKRGSPDGCDLYPIILLLYGDWLSETMSDRPSVILDKYLFRSCQIYEKKVGTSQVEAAKAHFALAKYADLQYQNVTKYMKSDVFSEKLEYYKKAQSDVAANANAVDQDARRTLMVLRKQSHIDEDEIKTTVEERRKFLLLALRHYLRGLKDSNDQDLLIFRAVALWLENSESDEPKISKEVNSIFKQEIMPSYKYLIVLHQLSARLSAIGSGGDFITILSSILVKCAQQHPYHTMPVLLTQALLHKDKELGQKNNGRKVEDRVKAASNLVGVIKKNKALAPLVKKMESLWNALIELANVHETRNTVSPGMIPADSSLARLRELDSVTVPTTVVPVSMSGEYSDLIVGIRSFMREYYLVGGINSPKRISCLGTNGKHFNMLLKGQDDLRQDAVMQQVFGVMNKLLLVEPKTKARRLHVRTYKVVPLSQRSGILEWCENTQTFGDYLTNNDSGAHQKYRPNDYLPQECRRKMLDVKDCGDNDRKYGNFMTILEHFKPVFRHFFFENFKEAGNFFEKRLAYTRSVATNSMVGYILGLGDRHVLNILVDRTTAEFIHIDLGVAFEQGRILPTPETIPFRLTRDVVDGMGVSGVEGVFRKSCEMTLEVLRNNSEIILTILEVLLYDPLYMWTLTTDRMKKVQPTSRENLASTSSGTLMAESPPKERNNSAARVLLRLKQKLVGIEEGGSSGSALSVTGHVSHLIQQAMDPQRLSRLFPGWQPYL